MLPEAPARVAHTASIPTIQARVEEQMNAGLLVQSDQLVGSAPLAVLGGQVCACALGPRLRFKRRMLSASLLLHNIW